jgi:hypothetical protein
MSIVGGLAQAKQLRLVAQKPEIIVATPGRYHDLMSNSIVNPNNPKRKQHQHLLEFTLILTRPARIFPTSRACDSLCWMRLIEWSKEAISKN